MNSSSSLRTIEEVQHADLDSRGSQRPWVEAVKAVAITRAFFFLVAIAGAWLLASPDRSDFLSLWSRWDATIFVRIAEHGYTSALSDPHATAFFPLYPLTIALFSSLGLPPVAAGMLVSAVASVVASAFLYRLAESELGRGSGRRAILYLLLFPTSVFLIAPYSEALFLAGAIAAFYYARQGRWLAAALPAAVAMGSRLAGLFVLVGLATEAVVQRRDLHPRWRALVTLSVGLAPLLAYMAYLWVVKDDAFYFLTDQREGWGRVFPVNPMDALVTTWETGTGDYPPNWIFAWRVEIVAAFVGVAVTVWLFATRRWAYAAYCGSAMVALLASSWYFSVPRILLTLFPIILLMVQATRGNRGRHEWALVALAPLASLGIVVFTEGSWFF